MKRIIAAVALLFVAVTASGIEQIAYGKYLPTTAKAPTDTPTEGVVIPNDATGLLLCVRTQAIRYFANETTPTATSGMELKPDNCVQWGLEQPEKNATLKKLRFIESTSGADVWIFYFKH